MTNAENSNICEILNESYYDEFPAFHISQIQKDKMVNDVTNGTTMEDICSGKNGMA